ncbi:MAG: polyketide synthase, partial [Deltaproteobacteria bacterium]
MEIAIVGLGCRFPGARDPLAYWELIRSGTVVFRPIPASRWDHSRFYDPTTRVPDKAYIDKGAFLTDEELREFASLHYGIAPRRIQVTDPQHRLLLDCVSSALQDAGYERRAFERTRAGVFVGASVSEHKEFLLSRIRAVQLFDGAFGRALSGPEADNLRDALIEHVVPMRAFSMPGNLLNMAAAIVAQTWNLGGPALSVDAACSSALVATQQAIVNLRGGQIDLAIAGGVYLNLLPDNLVCFSRIGALSRRGECRPFDAGADGFVMGEGAGVVVLKRLDDALRDGDRIYAVVKGAAANNDGRSEGPMTPRQGGQLEALRMAYRDAAISPTSLGYLEAHGTATTVGDVVEVRALRQLFDEAGWTAGGGIRTALG